MVTGFAGHPDVGQYRPMKELCAERQRLSEEAEQAGTWSKWGPYLSERQWGTVREDYSADGNAWD
ncbi:MAG: hypothetical protein ACI8W8_003660, partial [Rhodothermales bacterium]